LTFAANQFISFFYDNIILIFLHSVKQFSLFQHVNIGRRCLIVQNFEKETFQLSITLDSGAKRKCALSLYNRHKYA
jgi:hypothetical protein